MKDPTDSMSIFKMDFFILSDPGVIQSMQVFANNSDDATSMLTKTGATVIKVQLIDGPIELDI